MLCFFVFQTLWEFFQGIIRWGATLKRSHVDFRYLSSAMEQSLQVLSIDEKMSHILSTTLLMRCVDASRAIDNSVDFMHLESSGASSATTYSLLWHRQF